jgi:hypothetical protein
VDDLQLWHLGIERIDTLFAALPDGDKLRLTELLARYRMAKEALAAVVAEVDAASLCSECGGQCCLNGKYRINVLDALSRIAAQITTSADFTRKPGCPYGTETGCAMESGLRPADCVVFICDAIDRKLSPQARSIVALQELDVRECLNEASRLTGEKLGTPLLLWVEAKNAESNSKV